MNTTLKNALKWSVITGLFAIPFIPFVITRSLLFPFITGKGFVFRILIEVLFALWAFLAIADPAYRPKWNAITKSILAFVIVVFFADLLSKYPYKSFWSNYERMEGFVTIVHLAMYYFVASTVLVTETWWKRFWNTELIASIGVSIYGFLQLAGKITVDQGGTRLDGPFGNASYMAIYMVFNIFIACVLLLKEKQKVLKWAYGILALVESVILFNTATRGAILGLIGGAILAALIVIIKTKRNDPSKKLSRRIAGSLLILVVVVFGLFISLRKTAVVQNSPVLRRFADVSLSSSENEGRTFVWPMAVKGFLARPVLGWGQESFNYVFNTNYNPAMYTQEQWFDRSHDIFLDWLINAGILGLAAYISLFVGLIYILYKRTNFSVEEKALLVGLLAAYTFHNIFVFDNQTSYILFFGVLAWVSALSFPKPRPVGEKAVVTSAPRMVSSETLNYLVAPVLVIALVLCVYFVNVPGILASRDLIQGISGQADGPATNLAYFQKAFDEKSFGTPETLEQLITVAVQVIQSQNAQITDTIKQGFYALTDAQIKAQIARTPQDARYLLLAGSFYDSVGQYDTAITYLNNAIKYSPGKPAMYFEMATSYLGKGDPDTAFQYFSKGYNLAPDAPDSQIVYAVGAIYDKQSAVVTTMFQKIGQAKIVSDDRILSAYIGTKDYTDAEQIVMQRIAQDPTNYNTELELASLYATAGQKAQAIAVIKDVEAKDPSSKTQLDPYILQLSK